MISNILRHISVQHNRWTSYSLSLSRRQHRFWSHIDVLLHRECLDYGPTGIATFYRLWWSGRPSTQWASRLSWSLAWRHETFCCAHSWTWHQADIQTWCDCLSDRWIMLAQELNRMTFPRTHIAGCSSTECHDFEPDACNRIFLDTFAAPSSRCQLTTSDGLLYISICM